jgi:signal transduction histidine kinase
VRNHERRVSPPPPTQSTSLPSRHHGTNGGAEVELLAALSGAVMTDWIADLQRANTATDRQARRFSRVSNSTARVVGKVPESQQALRQAACATAVADDRERIASELYDTVIHRLFGAGLQLQATCQVVDGAAQTRIEATIDLLDTTIAELRKAIFSLH